MKKAMKRKSMLLALALITALCLAGCGGDESQKDAPEEEAAGLTKIGFLHQDATWEMYQIEEKAVKEQCDKAGIELVTANPSSDAHKQLEQFESMVNSGCQAVICVTVDGKVLEDAVKKAADEKGVIFVSQFIPMENSSADIAVDEYDYGYTIGKMGAEYCAKNFGDEEVECAIIRVFDYEPGIERAEGMRAALADIFPTGKVVNEQDCNDTASAMTATEAILAANPDCRVFLCDSDDTGGIGAYEALMSKVKPEDYDKYVVVGADGTDQGIKLTKEGGMYRGTVDLQCDQLGIQAFNICKDLFEGKELEKTQYLKVKAVDYDVANKDY